MRSQCSLQGLSDDELLRRLVQLLQQSRRVESDLVAHIAEVERRRLYAREASPSMFAYCTDVLRLSEAEAYLRINVARASRLHPVLLEMLADGRLHLTGIARIAPHLTAANRDTLLRRATHRSRRQIEELVAELQPRPDAVTSIRRLPGARHGGGDGGASRSMLPVVFGTARVVPDPPGELCPDRVLAGERLPSKPEFDIDHSDHAAPLPSSEATASFAGAGPESAAATTPSRAPLPPPTASPALAALSVIPALGSSGGDQPDRAEANGWADAAFGSSEGGSTPSSSSLRPCAAGSSAPPIARSRIEPLAPSRYRVQFTATAELRDKLERLRALMRPQVPDGNLAAIIDAAVTEKLERIEARRFAKSTRPRTSPQRNTPTPASVEVVVSSPPTSAVHPRVQERDPNRDVTESQVPSSAGRTRSLPPATIPRRSRHVPAAVRRAVLERDGGRCGYRDPTGRRCPERGRLEFHHRMPYGVGGGHEPDNVGLLCKTHNLLIAELDYGRTTIERYRRSGEAPPDGERRPDSRRAASDRPSQSPLLVT